MSSMTSEGDVQKASCSATRASRRDVGLLRPLVREETSRMGKRGRASVVRVNTFRACAVSLSIIGGKSDFGGGG